MQAVGTLPKAGETHVWVLVVVGAGPRHTTRTSVSLRNQTRMLSLANTPKRMLWTAAPLSYNQCVFSHPVTVYIKVRCTVARNQLALGMLELCTSGITLAQALSIRLGGGGDRLDRAPYQVDAKARATSGHIKATSLQVSGHL